MSGRERGSQFGLNGLQQRTIGIRGQATATQHHNGMELRRMFSQIAPRRGLTFVKSFVRRTALAEVSFTVERRWGNFASIILTARHARALGCTDVYGFCMAVYGSGMAPADPKRTPRRIRRRGKRGTTVLAVQAKTDPERTPRVTRRRRKWETACLAVQEKTGTIARARKRPKSAAKGCTTAGPSIRNLCGTDTQPVEITGTIGHHGERVKGTRIRLPEGTA